MKWFIPQNAKKRDVFCVRMVARFKCKGQGNSHPPCPVGLPEIHHRDAEAV